MSDERLLALIELSLRSDCQNEKRFALIMGRVLAMREAVSLESAINEDALSKALYDSGVNAMDATISILSMFWGRDEDK